MGVSKALRLKILERDNYTCVLCNSNFRSRPSFLHVDHKDSIKHGGTNDEINLRTLCVECNLRKGSATPECPNCRAAVSNTMIECERCKRPLTNAAVSRPDLIRTIARWAFLSVALLLLVGWVGSVAINYGANLLDKFRGNSVTAQTSAGGSLCKVSDAGRVNLRSSCDSLDCDNDSSTLVGKIAGGASVTKTGRAVSSGISSVGEWVEVIANGQTSYIAGSKLSCS